MKQIKKYYILLVFLLANSMNLYSLNLPIKNIGNTDFYCYKVQAKETIFGISKKLNISQDDLTKYNPSIVNGLKKDYILLIPVYLIADEQTDKKENNTTYHDNFTHVVAKGETLYGISKTYNVSQDSIISLNPSAVSGVKVGQVFIIPQPSNNNTKTTENTDIQSDIIYHTIAKGETLYSLSKRYNTTIEKILSLNPGVSPTNFKINEVIKVQANSGKSEKIAATITTMESYVAEKNDDYKKIAQRTGVDIKDLKAANPNTNKIKEGLTIQIPVVKEDSITVSVNEGSENDLSDNGSERIQEIFNSIYNRNENGEINVALILPYMLNDTLPSKQALLYTEFYKGFLLAVNDVSKEFNSKINIYTYDNKDNVNIVKDILCADEMKKMNLIFTSDDISQLNEISRFCEENKIYLVNAFSLKSENYNDNPYFFQINVPQTFMQADVCEWLETEFCDYEIVFIHKQGSIKKEMSDDIKNHLSEKGFKIHDIEYKSMLSYDIVNDTLKPANKYLFIPTTGTKSVMAQILPVVKRLRTDRLDLETAVMGYPEWVTYIEDWIDDFHETNTYFYSRFFSNPDDCDTELFANVFEKWYGNKMINAAPQFGLLGYDTGKYFLTVLNKHNNDLNNLDDEYIGLQSAFKFERISNWSGYVNKSIFIIHFTPENKIKTEIR